MDVETWCAQNNLTKANYYYRLRRVREVCLGQIQDTAAPIFVKLPVPDAFGAKKVYLAMGFTNLRRGNDGPAIIIRFQFKPDPYDKNALFLFCERRCDRIKTLLWEGDGFLLMYKGFDNGAFR